MQYFTFLLPLFASAFAAPSPVGSETDVDAANAHVEARADFPYGCGGFATALTSAAVDLLKDLYDRPLEDLVCRNTGPSKCAPFISNFGATFVLCNDNTYPKCIANRELADRSNFLLGRCGEGRISGQIFAPDNTNIIIRAP
ncbi:hypothetical protein KC343_g4414 [Hortaea werneckii]|nr:hypothetical protein KC352_g11921 [Hortaea werneckii]KAI7566905.1 hypothetical protein KC317_g5350 [Hortaea werneckii]KAI7618556.1 hypothetical protein KC346_g4951 [Hortaea werneckii]KAI7630783.1 hypothetical protein KC343_g4414 [Hortaea werneckii]KAI7676735.1 hypothetical protein KC319_g4285 [Hortaea werneckii]